MNINSKMNRAGAGIMLARLMILVGAVVAVIALLTAPFAGSVARDFFATLVGGSSISVAIWAIAAKKGNMRALILVGCTLFFLSWFVYLSSWDGQVNKPALLIVELVSLAIILAFALSTHQQFNGRYLVFTPTGARLPVSRLVLIGALVIAFGTLSILAWVLFPEQASDMNQIVLLIYVMLTLVGILNTQRDIFFVLLLWVFPVVVLLILQIIAGPLEANVFRWLWENPDKWAWIGLAYLFHTAWFLVIFASKFAESFVTQGVYGLVRDQFGNTLQRIGDELDEAVAWSLFPVVFYFIIANSEWLMALRWDVAGFWWPFVWILVWAVLVRRSNQIREQWLWVVLAIVSFLVAYFLLPWQPFLVGFSAATDGMGPLIIGAAMVIGLVKLLTTGSSGTPRPPASAAGYRPPLLPQEDGGYDEAEEEEDL